MERVLSENDWKESWEAAPLLLSGGTLTMKKYHVTALGELLTFANAAAALVTTRRGALRVMPSKEEVEALLAQNP